MSNAEQYIKLKEELDIYRKVMTQACDIILAKDVSDYPICIAHQQELDMGLAIVEKDEKNKWSILASSLEEFVTKGIIHGDKIDDFKKNYKDSKLSICVFVLSELGAQFVFLPRKEAN